MECFDNTTAFSELSITKASELRCNGRTFPTCGQCECCEIGNQLAYTKQWFLRCAEQIKRQFVLGLVHRFNSADLHDYINTLLTTLEGKDFTYARSRNRPSLKGDTSTSSSNHALNKWQVNKDMVECLSWFESRRYWTKCNFMLGLMQVCNAQLLQIIGSESRSLCLLNNYETDWKEVTDTHNDEYESSSLKVTFDTVYSSSQSLTQDIDHPTMISNSRKSSTGQRPRSAMKHYLDKKSQESRPSLGVSFSQKEETWEPPHSAKSLRKQPQFNCETSSTDNLKDDAELFDDLDDDYISVDPSSVADPPLSYSCLLVQQHKDFIRCLPVHLSKLILSYLDKASLINCLCISKHWRYLSEEVQQDTLVHQIMVEEVMMMQGATAKGLNPKYAKKLLVCVPSYEAEVKHVTSANTTNHLQSRNNEIQSRSMAYCYEGVETVKVEMEERNLFCGAYNVFVLQDSEDPNRCTTYNGGHLVACGSSDRRVRLLDASTGRSDKNITGHAGSVKCLYISEKRGFVLSGSYDTSIRCWDIRQGKCQCIFRGHRASVLCVALSGNNLASGSRDKSVKDGVSGNKRNIQQLDTIKSNVDITRQILNNITLFSCVMWNFETGKCRRTFRHHHVVLCVEVTDSIVVSGCEGCKVKVWEIESATLVKTLEGHHCPISGVTFNKYHIISSSKDCYALAWSAIGKYKKCLQAFRHPKEVLCVKFMYCRLITGAADGKLRVWNLLNGDCLRIIRGNSKNDVITSLYIADNRIVINTLSNLLILNFEAVSLNYNLAPDRPESLGNLRNYSKCPARRRPRSYVRAQKQARGVQMESLISTATLSCPPFSGYLDRSVSMTPCTIQASSSRVSSAPPVSVTRQVTQSIDHHVQRLNRAREHKPRPHSSPAKIRQRTLPDQPCSLATEQSVVVNDVVRPSLKPGPLPGKHSQHVLSRGRSAPAIRTKVLPGNERGWTTSAKDVVLSQSNKLMPTASQSREMMKKRSKSAHMNVARKNEVSPLKSVSCLNLKTYSAQDDDWGLLKMETKDKKDYHRRTREKTKIHRPVSCIT